MSEPSRCESCRYCEHSDHTCRRNPPLIISERIRNGIAFATWPMVSEPVDWCGEYSRKES